jgi:hypothetical protein
VSNDERKESVRSAWTRTLRQEALRMRSAAVSRIVHVGIIIATYADSDGTHATMAGPTLAAITGYSEETITRATRVLVAVGLMERKRRPNLTAMHTLLMPLGDVDWNAHLHLYTNNRQQARRQQAKAEEVQRRLAEVDPGDVLNPFTPAYWAANPDSDWRPLGDPEWQPPTGDTRNPSADAVRNPFPTGGPEPVPDGDSGTRSRRGVHNSGTRPRTGTEPDRGRSPEPVPDGGEHSYLPSVGHPLTDTDLVEPVPQPQVRAREAGANDHPSPQLQAIEGGGHGQAGGQAPLLLSVHTGPAAPLDHALIAGHMTDLYGVPVPVRVAATTAVRIADGLDLPDPTAYVLAALDATPDAYRPDIPAARRRAAGGDS